MRLGAVAEGGKDKAPGNQLDEKSKFAAGIGGGDRMLSPYI